MNQDAVSVIFRVIANGFGPITFLHHLGFSNPHVKNCESFNEQYHEAHLVLSTTMGIATRSLRATTPPPLRLFA